MIDIKDLKLEFGERILFQNVNLKFTKGNCYGIIGANGSGKTTFLKMLYKEILPTIGEILINKKARISVLQQNHYIYDNITVIDTVILGNKKLYDIMKEKDSIYAKPDFNNEDGIKAAMLEQRFSEMNGWEAESDAATLLDSLGIYADKHKKSMKDLLEREKVKVLLAQSLYQNPDILLLDEPTNGLNISDVKWLEKFLNNYENTVLVISHDKHFLNNVCTHMVNIDYEKIQLYVGNFDEWEKLNELMLTQIGNENKKKEDRIKELQGFIDRFGAKATKASQANSRKKMLEHIILEEIKPSTRKFPSISFECSNNLNTEVLNVKGITKEICGQVVLNNVSFKVNTGDKIAIIDNNGVATTELYNIISNKNKADSGSFKWGDKISVSYFKNNFKDDFNQDINIVQWLTARKPLKEPMVLRKYLGRMLFSDEEALKNIKVLSGGEKVRCILADIMLNNCNCLIFDEPTSHLDLESVEALTKALNKFEGCVFISSSNYDLMESTINRIIEIQDNGILDKKMSYSDYLKWKNI